MALLFVGGIMNLYWIGGLALYVLVEKTVSGGRFFGRISGGALVLVGAWLLLPLSG
jgi:predicted metal-binding membrane protein